MKDPVLHVYDPDGKVDPFTVNQMHTTRGRVLLHIDHSHGVDCYAVTTTGAESQWVATTGGCGCP